MKKKFTRKEFLKLSAATIASLAASKPLLAALKHVPEIDNPLAYYPNKDWEKIYRSQFKYDSTFHFLCAPNDTHNCLLKCYVKNDVVTRIGPSYGYGKAKDVYGNQASSRWEPRLCNKGIVMNRRVYGPRRVKGPMIREGFKKWVDAGFPRGADGRPPVEYFQRGKENFIKLTWDEAYDYAAKSMINIATTYSGEAGKALLTQQGYDPASIEAMNGAGVQAMKFRGGMPLLGITRILGYYRLCNSMAILDTHVRGVSPDEALGGRGWDNYSWHTDLPPGHPMVSGQQTVEFDLMDAENAKLIIPWGMNWISTKMPDAHWLTEARVKGAKVVSVTVEYSSVASKSDEVVIIRPGTDPAFALGLAGVIMREKLYDEEYVMSSTDLPFLVRMDTLKLLKADEVLPDYKAPDELRDVTITKKGEKAPFPSKQGADQHISETLLKEWGSFVVWDKNKNAMAGVSREDVGKYFKEKGIAPVLDGEFEVDIQGQKVKVRTIFSLVSQYINDNFNVESVSKITWAPQEAVLSLAHQIAENRGKTLIAVGMGPNHFFNNDLKDRAIFLLCSLTRNIGTHGGNIGSYAGNYRVAFFDGVGQYISENPFNIEADETKPSNVRQYFKYESAHYYNHGDTPLRIGNKLFTGKSHMPTPTKSLMFANANSILGNLKGHYDMVVNVIPKIEMITVNDWWWTASCEYGDIVFGVDSWAELKYPDATASVTNDFLQMFPRTPLKRLHDTRGDIEVFAGVGAALGKNLNDSRFVDYWKFVHENKVEAYLQRIMNASAMTKGYNVLELEENAKNGIPALLMSRTHPKIMGWEQTQENKKWYTKTGRLEFYREEDEFIEYGENLPVYREPVDATIYEPNVIVAKPHPALKPAQLEKYGLSSDNQSTDVRQVRNVVKTPEELIASEHPLRKDGFSHVYITPKYRHGVHTTPVDLDVIAMWFGPFGDPYRKDKRKPWVGEGYVDINPEDAKSLGIEDGDYIWVDADPEDRPYRGEKIPGSENYRLARLMLRARYYLGIPRSVSRSWFHMYGSTYGSVEGHLNNPDGLARNPRTGYQAMYRFGSHQSCTRGWLKPTLMTESLVRKDTIGRVIGKGFAPDVHCPTGAPKESFVKFTKAEDGGYNGDKKWRPAKLGLRPTYETDAMKNFLKGAFIQ
ncbi:MAG: molybdopterin oxidoreductase [Omnitrophica WOR_2 bacterium RIFOXYC2_FULL_43_9]|nr:MAG: molybdopterin oxidoreductase [Omnitrophica WOR_2 bacterium RIFOXYC2_FULL_43_9]